MYLTVVVFSDSYPLQSLLSSPRGQRKEGSREAGRKVSAMLEVELPEQADCNLRRAEPRRRGPTPQESEGECEHTLSSLLVSLAYREQQRPSVGSVA